MKNNSNSWKLGALILSSGLLMACGSSDHSVDDTKIGARTGEGLGIKNVIMMIGDGMGPQQLGLLEDFVKRAPTTSPYAKGEETAITTFAESSKGTMALSMNGPNGSLVVDSACSAGQLATGVPSLSEALSVDINGNSVPTILEMAKQMGKSTGLVSDTRATHATPAAFASHQPHRSYENEIADEMLNDTQVDVILSGGLRYWIPQGSSMDNIDLVAQINEPTVRIKSKRNDDRNLLTQASAQGYSLAFNATQLDSIKDGRILGLFAYSGMDDGIAYSNCKKQNSCVQPSLADMTKKALETLSKDEDGFFLMIEGGQIDWAGHNNDTATMLHELLKFDEAVAAVYDWVQDRDDTLVVITADHETGSFGFSYSRTDLPVADASIQGDEFGTHIYHPNFNFGELSDLDKIYMQKESFYSFISTHADDTPAQLATAFNLISEFEITEQQAEEILANEANSSQAEAAEKYNGHKYLDVDSLPAIHDFEEFYVYGEEIKTDLIARKVAAGQNTVWGTGTHTSVPVPVIVWGPEEAVSQYKGLMHHVEVGSITIKALKNNL